METKEFIVKQVTMIENGFGKKQIRDNVWEFVSKNYMGVIKLDAMIDMSMEIYGEITMQAVGY